MIYENDYFKIEHAKECAIPGYLVLYSKEKASSLVALPNQAQQALGPTLAHAQQAINEAIETERVYILSIGEQLPLLHFHIFPRTRQMLIDYQNANPTQNAAINGMHLFNWARSQYYVSSDYYDVITNSITATIKSLALNNCASPIR